MNTETVPKLAKAAVLSLSSLGLQRCENEAMPLDWSQCAAVESVPGKVSGAWVFKGTRMPVAVVFENLEDGMTIDELIETYHGLTRQQVQAVLDFAARSLRASEPAHAR